MKERESPLLLTQKCQSCQEAWCSEKEGSPLDQALSEEVMEPNHTPEYTYTYSYSTQDYNSYIIYTKTTHLTVSCRTG